MKKIDIVFMIVSISLVCSLGYRAYLDSANIESRVMLSEALDRKVAHDKVLDASLREAMELLKE